MAKIDPSKLTVDFKSLMRLSMSDRYAMAQSSQGRSYLASLTPTQFAMLFPDYYRQRLPDMGISSRKGAPAPSGAGSRPSGGTPSSGASTSTTSSSSTQSTTQPKKVQPQAGEDARFGWEKRLEEEAKKYDRKDVAKSQTSAASINLALQEQRQQFFEALDKNPKLKEKLFAVAANEQGTDQKGVQGIMESLINRAIVRGGGVNGGLARLEKEIRFTSEGGYYEDTRGQSRAWNAVRNPKNKNIFEGAYEAVRTGSNVSKLAYGNASAGTAQSKIDRNFATPTARINEETFFGPNKDEKLYVRRYASWKEELQRRAEEIERSSGINQASTSTRGNPSQTGSTKQTNLRPSESFDYENFYKQVGTFREGGGRYGNLNISAGSKTEFGGRGAGAYGGLCGVGVSNAVGVLFGKNEFKKVFGMHAGSFSMAGKNETFQKSGLYQAKRGLSDEEFNNIRAAGNNHGYPPGTIIAVGSTSGAQHIQIWDGRRWISDTVQRSLLGLRRGESGTAAIHIPNAQGINSLPSPIRQNISSETLEKYVGMSRQDISTEERTAQDNRQNYNSSKNLEKPDNYDQIPESIRKVIDGLPESRRNSVLANLNKMPPEHRVKFLGEISSDILNSKLEPIEKKKALGDVVTKLEDAPLDIPNFKIWQEQNPGSVPTREDRQRIFREGGVVVNMDTNHARRGMQTGPLVVIPDNATDEQRGAAQEYVKAIEKAYKDKFGKSLPGRVVTRSQNNDTGLSATMHTEPFSVNDDKALEYFHKDPEGRKVIAQITSTTLGKIPGVIFSEPHNIYKKTPDPGAISEKYNINEVDISRTLKSDMASLRDQISESRASPPTQNATPTSEETPSPEAPSKRRTRGMGTATVNRENGIPTIQHEGEKSKQELEFKRNDKILDRDAGVAFMHSRNPVGANLKDVDPSIMHVAAEGIRNFENKHGGRYSVRMLGSGGGKRHGTGSYHSHGTALDYVVIDNRTGKELTNFPGYDKRYGFQGTAGENAPIYQELGNYARVAAEKFYPEKAKTLRAGVYGDWGPNALDSMHIDWDPKGRGMGGGTFEKGFTKKFMERYGIPSNTPIGDIQKAMEQQYPTGAIPQKEDVPTQERTQRQNALSTASTPTQERTPVGSSRPTGLTPESPAPTNAAQQNTTPPKESPGFFSRAYNSIFGSKEEPVPAKYAGGEVQTRGDTATVINNKGEPIARINPDKERISLTETGNLDVQPTYRTDPRALEQQNVQRQEVGNMNIDDRMQEMSTNIMNQVRQLIPQGGNPNWESMMTSIAAAKTLTESPSYTFSNESFRRAMAGARFEKTGDSALGGHFEIANSNLT